MTDVVYLLVQGDGSDGDAYEVLAVWDDRELARDEAKRNHYDSWMASKGYMQSGWEDYVRMIGFDGDYWGRWHVETWPVFHAAEVKVP